MSPKEQKFSFSMDMETLAALRDSQVEEILKLLRKKRPSKADIRKRAPDSFLRLLLAHAKLDEATDVSDEVKQASAPLMEWFDEKMPAVMSSPGYEAFLRQSVEAMGTSTVSIPSTPTDAVVSISERMGIVNSFNSLPFLAGSELRPSLRVFMMNRDNVLFDSSGDWNDWLYVVKSLLVSIEEQSETLAKSPDSWKSVPWKRTLQHLRDIKAALQSFDKRIRDNVPSDIKVPSRRRKKN